MTSMNQTQLNEQIRQALLRDGRLSEHEIVVTIQAGVARLEGSVQSHRRKLAVLETVASFVGSDAIDDRIRVEMPEPVTDEMVAEHTRRALARHPHIIKGAVTVNVRDGAVTICGSVASERERMEAEDVVLGVAGVSSVENLLVVDEPGQAVDRDLRQRIEHAIAQELGPDGAGIRVAIAADTAVLSGGVPTPWHRERAQEIASRSRILGIRNEIEVVGIP